jgi:GntR family transcriptional regulator of arabinose operon
MREDKTPKYQVLSDYLRKEIRDGRLAPGQRIPSENELVKEFELSRVTVRHAIDILEEENLLVRMKGSGCYVSERLAGSGKKRIAVMMTYLDGYIFPQILQAIESTLSAKGYSIQIAFTNNQVMKEREILQDILEKDEVAGVIAETTKSALSNPNVGYYEKLVKRNVPVLFINSFYPESKIPHVSMNDVMVGKIATEHLIQRGHKEIAGIFKLDDGQGHQRFLGYMQALEEANLPLRESNILWIDTMDVKQFGLLREKVLSRLKGCTGVVCYNDEVAYELYRMLEKEGIRVPEDMSIMGVDASEDLEIGSVGISTVPYPIKELGAKAARNILRMIRMPGYDGNHEYAVKVLEKGSVKDLNK